MAGLSGGLPLFAGLGADAINTLRSLATRGALRGLVVEVQGKLTVQVGGRQFPVPENLNVVPGQSVEVLFDDAEDIPRLRILPSRADAPAPSTRPGTSFNFRVTPSIQQALNTLGAGGPHQGRIVATPNGLALEVRNTQVPLPSDVTLPVGARAELVVSAESNSVRVSLLPPQSSPPSQSAESLTALVRQVLSTLDVAPNSRAESVATLLPRSLPLSQTVVRSAVELLTARGALGNDLATLIDTLTHAEQRGVLTRDTVQPLAQLLTRVQSLSSQEVANGLQQWVREAASPVERLLASLLTGGRSATELQTVADLRTQVARWRTDTSLRGFLQPLGEWDGFVETADRVLQRLAGGQVQNARGIEETYLFLEIPMNADQGVRSAQIHFFGEGGSRDGKGSQPGRVILDLSTSALGDMLVFLEVLGENCACTFRATTPETLTVLEKASRELADSLKDAGFAQSRVGVTMWNGDRIEALAEAMPSLAGLNVTA